MDLSAVHAEEPLRRGLVRRVRLLSEPRPRHGRVPHARCGGEAEKVEVALPELFLLLWSLHCKLQTLGGVAASLSRRVEASGFT